MSSADTEARGQREADAEALRFRRLFGREPSEQDLAVFRSAHHALTLGVAARVRRRTARMIARW